MVEVHWSDFTQEVEKIENDTPKSHRENDAR